MNPKVHLKSHDKISGGLLKKSYFCAKYQGEFKHNSQTGYGYKYYIDDSLYEREFNNGLREGFLRIGKNNLFKKNREIKAIC